MSSLKIHIKDIDLRLATAEGHIKAIRQMVDQEKSCDEILLQIFAVKGSLEKLSKLILLSHASTCVKSAVEHKDIAQYEQFITVLDKYLDK